MKLKRWLAALAIFIAGGAAAQTPTIEAPNIKAIDLYGTSRITAEQVRLKFGVQIEQLVKSYAAEDQANSEMLEKRISDGIKEMGDFAMARVSAITYFAPERHVYVTVDVVESKDRATRMGFLPAPSGEYADPDGLFKLWREYETAGWDLMNRGQINFNFQLTHCPAFHCIFGFDHPQLKKYEEAFNAGALKHKARLFEILKTDRAQSHRGYAAYLLAHTKEAPELVAALLPAIKDSSSFVRNNVLRVLAHIAQSRKDLRVPIAPILEAIEFPETTDRNKSLYVLDGLADRPENKQLIIDRAGATLIKILKLAQPNNHDPAYSILKKVSGQQYGERDYSAWEQWLKKTRDKK